MRQAKLGDTVRVHYTGKLDDGTIFDASAGDEPMELTLGQGREIPGFDMAIIGMSPGESKIERVPCEMAYGPHQEELTVEVDRALFAEGEITPQPGLQLEVNGPNGEPVPVVVREVSGRRVTLDANHPLAGQDLIFEIELVEVL